MKALCRFEVERSGHSGSWDVSLKTASLVHPLLFVESSGLSHRKLHYVGPQRPVIGSSRYLHKYTHNFGNRHTPSRAEPDSF